jgi:methionine sulfoxide reductase heme-binding subunit
MAAPILFPKGPVPWLKPAVFAGALVPLGAIGGRAALGRLGADPIAIALNQLGLLALICLVASLACTPLKIVTGAPWPIRIRKMLGLFALFYASLHLLTYAVLDQGLALGAIGADILKRPFILFGFLAVLLLIPLGITSTAKMVKRMGFVWWKRLHRLAYAAGSLGALHFFLRVKKDASEPLAYAAVLGVLFVVRAVDASRGRAPVTRGGAGTPSP